MKSTLILATVALACGAAFAQAPAGSDARPAHQQNPSQSGGKPQAVGEMRNDMRTMMDSNKDGMISRTEWDRYHSGVWSSMRADKSGNVRWDDVNTHMMGNARGGPVGVGGQVGSSGSATPQ